MRSDKERNAIMPYYGEHACRVFSPEECSEFRRKNGEREHEGKKYDVIYGKKKDGGEWVDQAYRYPVETWSADEARSHCESHDGLFEAAASGDGGGRQTGLPWGAPLPSVWAMLAESRLDVLNRVRAATHGHYTPPRIPTITTWGSDSIITGSPATGLGIKVAKGSVAVIPIRGVIVQHASDLWYGDIATDWISRAMSEMVANQSVGAIVLDIDSPGGVVFGVEETAAKIRALRDQKPIYAVANSMAASAAYWIGSAATKLFVTSGGQVGSIGVWNMHVDISKMEENFGIKTTLVSAGKYKVEGHPWAPLDDEARAEMQRGVDVYYEKFVAGVAENRGVKTVNVRKGFGEGRLVMADAAKAEGMVDGIATLEDVLSALIKETPQGSTGRRVNTASAQIALANVWNH